MQVTRIVDLHRQMSKAKQINRSPNNTTENQQVTHQTKQYAHATIITELAALIALSSMFAASVLATPIITLIVGHHHACLTYWFQCRNHRFGSLLGECHKFVRV